MPQLHDPYEIRFRQQMNAYSEGLSEHLEFVSALAPDIGDKILAYLLELACQCQHVRNIELGRTTLTELPREWLLERIERMAGPLLQLNDEWEYRRLLEVYERLDKTLVQKLVRQGLASHNSDIRETAEEYLEYPEIFS